MEAKRSKAFLIGVFIILFALCMRIFYFAVFKNVPYSKAVESQSVTRVSVGKRRGIIYDRNGIPLTDRKTEKVYIGERGLVSGDKSKLEIVRPQRYDQNGNGVHTVGYATNESGGMWGIEKIYDHILSRDEENFVSYSADSLKSPMKDVSLSREFGRDDGNGVRLTLDYHIQKIAEKVMDEHIEKGAVVILDVDSFDVLAMASRPEFDKNEIESHLSSNGTEMLNRSLCQYNPGSVFKIVTSICAIENNPLIANLNYECKGSFITPDTLSFLCHKKEGHGKKDMKSAFADSCNCFFYNLGMTLGGEKITQTARKLGLGEKLLCFGDEEASGEIPQKDYFTFGDCANISIGQGDVMITPLQCAALSATVASGGVRREVNIADSVIDGNGNTMLSLRRPGEYEAMNEHTAKVIGEMMRECVISGTGQDAGSCEITIAGKTGSAETGWILSDGSLCVQGWFCGYFPYEEPKYAMAILSENGKSGSQSCVEPFVKICEEINKIYPLKQ